MLLIKTQILLFKKITRSRNAWHVFDKNGIPGFGTHLLRLYFPIYYNEKTSRNSFSPRLVNKIIDLFIKDVDAGAYEDKVFSALAHIVKLPLADKADSSPFLDNHYFGIFDAAVLSAMMETYQPRKIIEIGSGVSTRYMKLFKQQFELETEIICIDPQPRVEIAAFADRLIKKPLEQIIDEGGYDLNEGDFLFMDGSHYIFQGNDTLTFFFKLLPDLPSGVIIHIHDIYLPFDYSQGVGNQLWTEQYILAAMLESGLPGYEVLYPAYYISRTHANTINALKHHNDLLNRMDFKVIKNHDAGFSFWMVKK